MLTFALISDLLYFSFCNTYVPASWVIGFKQGIFHTQAIASADGVVKPYHFERGTSNTLYPSTPAGAVPNFANPDLPRLLDFAFYTKMFVHREHSLWVRKLPDDYHPDTSDDPYGAVVVAIAKETNGDYSGLVLSRIGVRRRVVYAFRDLSEKDCIKHLVQTEVVTAQTLLPVAPGQNNPWTRDPFTSSSGNGSASPSGSNGQGSTNSSNTSSAGGNNDDRGDNNKSKELPLIKMRKTNNFAAVRSELVKWEASDKHSGYKFGILLAKEGETTEEEIYNGSSTSTPLFESFLSVIGDRVELVGYNGYSGGLDCKHGRTGTQSLATCIDDSNVMFHVVSMIPATSSEGIISKKRHIGNDMGIVIFKEGDEKLDVGAFRSQFNHFFIVVRPVSEGETSTSGPSLASPVRQSPRPIESIPFSSVDKSSDYIIHTKSSSGSSRSLLNSSSSSTGTLNLSGTSINTTSTNGDSLRTSNPGSSTPRSGPASLNLSGIQTANMLTGSGPLSPNSSTTPVYLGSTNFVSAFPTTPNTSAPTLPQVALAKSAVVHSALQTTTVVAHGKTVPATATATPTMKFSIEVVSKKGVPPSPPFLTESPQFELGPYMRQWILTKLLNLERMTQETVPIFRAKLEKVRAMALFDVTLVSNGKKIVDVVTPAPVVEVQVTPVRRGSVLKKTTSIESGMARSQLNDSNSGISAPVPHGSPSPPGSQVVVINNGSSGGTPDRVRKGSLLSHSAKNLSFTSLASDSSGSSSKVKDKKDKKEKGKRGRSGSLIEDPNKPSSSIKQHGSQGVPSSRHRPDAPNSPGRSGASPANCLSDGEYASPRGQGFLTSSMDNFRPGIVDPATSMYNTRGGSGSGITMLDRSADSGITSPSSVASPISPRSPRSASAGFQGEHSVSFSATPPVSTSSMANTTLSTIGETSISPREPMAPLSPRMLAERSMSPARPTRPAPAREVSPGRSGYTSDSRSPPRQLINPPHTTKHSSSPRTLAKASPRTASPVPGEHSRTAHQTEPIASLGKIHSEKAQLIDISDWDVHERNQNVDSAESGFNPSSAPVTSAASTSSSISSNSSAIGSASASNRPARAVPSPGPAMASANAGGAHAAPSRSLSLGVMVANINSPASGAAKGEKASATTSVVPAPASRPPAPARPAPSPVNVGRDSINEAGGVELVEERKPKSSGTISPILLTPPSASPPPLHLSTLNEQSEYQFDSPTSSATKTETASTSSAATFGSPNANAGRRKSTTLQRTSSGYDSDKLAASLARQAEMAAEGKNKAQPVVQSDTKIAHKAAFHSVKERWAQLQADPEPAPSPPQRRLVSARSMSDLRQVRSGVNSSKN